MEDMVTSDSGDNASRPVFRYTRDSDPMGSAISTFKVTGVAAISDLGSLVICSGPNPKSDFLVNILRSECSAIAAQRKRQRVGICGLHEKQPAIALLNLALNQIHRRATNGSARNMVLGCRNKVNGSVTCIMLSSRITQIRSPHRHRIHLIDRASRRSSWNPGPRVAAKSPSASEHASSHPGSTTTRRTQIPSDCAQSHGPNEAVYPQITDGRRGRRGQADSRYNRGPP